MKHKMMKHILPLLSATLLAVALLLPCAAAAQHTNPGYMGRHAVLTLNGNANANYGYLFPEELGYAYDALPVVFSPSLTVEYALSRRVSLALQGGTQTFGTKYSDRTRLDDLALTCRLYGNSGEKGRVAPLGAYIGYGLLVSRQRIDTLSTYHVATTVLDNGKTDYYRFGLKIEAGRNYIWMNRLVMNIGVSYTLVAGWPFNESVTMEDYDAERLFQNHISAATWMSHLVMLHLGIGLLPF